MESLTKEDEGMLWKLRALLMARGFYKRKTVSIPQLAKTWDVTERQAFRLLREADAIFKQLAGLFVLQPDLPEKPEEAVYCLQALTD